MKETVATPNIPQAVLDAEGPFVTLYLDTTAQTEDAPKTIDLRWQALRREAASGGASEAALQALDSVVDGAHTKGDGVAAIVSGDRLVLRRHLSQPIEDGISVGPLPFLLPLIEWEQDNPFIAVVLADRIGAEIHLLYASHPSAELEVEGDDWPVRRVSPGGWSQRRFQQRAENLWEENAEQVADVLTRLVAGFPLELVVVSGDVRAVGFLTEHLPENVSEMVHVIEGVQAHELEVIAEELHKTIAAQTGQTTESLLEVFREERGQADRAVEGWDATCDALRKAQVGTLFVTRAETGKNAYILPASPDQVALERATLEGLGLGEPAQVAASDALVRAALATGAAIRVIPQLPAEHGPAEGAGAILRYTT